MPTKTKQRTVKRGAAEIAAAMRVKFPSNAYAVLFEVGDSTGFQCSRHADAIVMSLWPSRGLGITGFEFKVSRSDWLQELKNPAKAEAIYKFCDAWALVVPDTSIVSAGELPESWGLMALNGKSLKYIKEPPKLSPVPLTREFVASVLRSASDPIAAVDDNAIRNARWEGEQDGAKRVQRTLDDALKKAEELSQRIREFERDSGVNISHRWSGGLSGRDVAAALSALKDGRAAVVIRDLERLAEQTKQLAESVTRDVTAIKSLASTGNVT